MDQLPALVPDAFDAEIAALARAYQRANGPVMVLINHLGGGLEAQMAVMPVAWRVEVERVTGAALRAAHGVAGIGSYAPDIGKRGTMLAAIATGAAGGAGGLAGSLIELPVTITVILHAIRREAVAAGYDPQDRVTRAACLEVFAAGSPLAMDDGLNTALISARLTLTGPALRKIIATVAPRLAAAMGQKLMAQAVPVLGALSGAALNAAFLNYYREQARIRFALLRLAERHGAERVLAKFAKATSLVTIRPA